MSIGGSLSGISFSGLSSGIDTEGIVSRLIQLESLPIRRLQIRQSELEARMNIYGQLRSRLQGVSSAAAALNSPGAFNPVKASSSDATVATFSATSSAQPGVFDLRVSRLAQAQKISSSAQSSPTDPRNLTGKFVVNGKGIDIEATDSLSQIAAKINAADAGVVAGVINGGAGNVFLTLTSSSTGADNKIQLADAGAGTVLQSLGLVAGAATIRQPITNGAASQKFESATAQLAEMLDLDGVPSAFVTVGNGQIEIAGTDTLDSIAAKINNPANGTNATATVRSETKDGKTKYWLEVTGQSGTPTLTDGGNWLQSIGILQRGYGNQTVQAQDAQYSLDGVNLTSSSNTITDVIPGATITLLKGDSGTPPATTLTVARDSDAVKKSIGGLMEAYNGLVDFIRTNSKFDSESFRSGPLFGDQMALQAEGNLASLVFDQVDGLTGPYRSLADIGFGIDENGKLTLDESTLDRALTRDPEAVGTLLRTTGSTTADSLEYIGSTSKTKGSVQGYDVNITQVATKGAWQGAAVSGTVTFSGSLFGSTPATIQLSSDVNESVTRINNDARLRELVTASNVNGELRIESKRFGTPGNFEIAGATGTLTAGVNVAGTINGEEATGVGQFLTGKTGNATTDGLQVQYTGTTTGNVGRVSVLKGVASQAFDFVDSTLDSVNGSLTAADQSLKAQFDDIEASITALNERLKLRESTLRQRFAIMEQTISQLQAQQGRLGAILNGGQQRR